MPVVKSLPMPLEPFFDSKVLLMGDVVLWGAVMLIVGAWWRADCPPLPEDSSDLKAMARIYDARHWRKKPQIDAALAEIMPMMFSIRVKMLEDKERRRQFAERMVNKRLAKYPKGKFKYVAVSELDEIKPKLTETHDEHEIGLLPHFSHKKDNSSWQNDGKTNQLARHEVIERKKKQTSTTFKTGLKDFT